MDSFEFNKIAGGILATALGVMAVSIMAEAIFAPNTSEKPGMVIEVAAAPAEGGASSGSAPQVAPIAVRLQSASVDQGKTISKKCQACHNLAKGAPNKVGPNLYNVVGSPLVHPDNGFNYSQAFKDKNKTGMKWTFANLDEFLTSPKAFIPGTAMGFAGLKKPEDRADIIAYLRTLSDNPVPLPTPAASGGSGSGGSSGSTSGSAAPAAGSGSAPAADSGSGASGGTSGDTGGASSGGTQTTPPATTDTGTQSTPPTAGSTTPPATGGSTTAPATGGDTTAPAQ